MGQQLLNITEESMHLLVASMPISAHLKLAQNDQYIATNKFNLRTYGFTKENELLGLTFDDLNDFMIPHWGKPFVEVIKQFDDRVKSTGKPEVLKNIVFKDKQNFIRYQDMHKIPIFHKRNKNKVNIILTMTNEHTDKISQTELFEKYKKLHPNKSHAITYFMRYLDIEKFFHERLTEKELQCLLCAKYNQAHKYIAAKLNINIRTVESHMANITDKLKNITLHNLIALLRKEVAS